MTRKFKHASSIKTTFRMLFLSLLLLPSLAKAQNVTVGTGTVTNGTNPINSCYGYSYTQQIYTAAEILAANGNVIPNGQIINLRFHLSNSSYHSGSTSSNLWTVYMGNVAGASFATATTAAWIPTTSMTQVFTGTVTFPTIGNWMTIPLAIPFTWDGTSNIVVAVDENKASWDCTMFWTSTSTSTNYRTLYYYDDSNNPDPASPPTPMGRIYERPNAQFQWAATCTGAANMPTAGAVTASPSSLCMSGNVTLNFTPNIAMPSVVGITYKWQTSPTVGGTYTDIPGAVTTGPTYTTTVPITAPAFFKCVVLCNGTPIVTSTASNQVSVTNPGSPTVTPGTRCGPGSVALSATPPAGSTINWYAAATGGLPLATTNAFNTPYIPTTTTFYAAAASGSSAANPQIGTATTSSGGTSSTCGPFSNYYRGYGQQLMYTAAEIIGAGGGQGVINSLAFNCTSLPTTSFPNYKIAIKTIPATNTTLTWQPTTSFTQVYTTASFMPSATGWQTFNFSTPFVWNGTDNIVLYICWDQITAWSSTGNHQYTNVTGRMLYYQDDNIASICGQSSGTEYTSTFLPNMKLAMVVGCEGTRLPVVATVSPAPTFTKANPTIVCNGVVDTLKVTSPLGNYGSYVWTPATDLYTNPAATTPYVAGTSASQVYFKSTTVGEKVIGVLASNATAPFCASADTVRLWVQPANVTIKAIPDTICVTGTSSLSLVPNSGYATGSIQWQSSPDGNTYTDIAGATTTNYTTGTLSAPTPYMYYRAQIKSDYATACQLPVKKIIIANPLLTITKDSFNCGPGVVTLEANTTGFEGVKWYTSMTAATPVGEGSPFTTPYLAATTNYYVAASVGTPQPAPTFVTSTTATTYGQNYTDLPFFINYYYGARNQYIIPASAMTAAGFTPGFINQIGYDIGAAGVPVENLTISLKNTTTTLFSTNYPSAFEAGTTPVYSTPSFQAVANQANIFNLATPFYWDGSNIIVEECHRNTSYGNGSEIRYVYGTYGSGVYGYSDAANVCTAAPAYATGSLPKIWVGMKGACESDRVEVTAYIHPTPEVNLGLDINKCVDEGAIEVLNAGVQPNTPSYLWDDGSNMQVRAINASGTYNVRVTNSYGCKGYDTIQVVLRPNPVVELGNDTTVCNGVTVNIDAGNDGIEYFWNTGAVSQNIEVNTPGTYNVFVTNEAACTKADTITINMQGELPSITGIGVNNNGQYTFQFTALNPQNVIGYDWDFGDGSLHSYAQSPTHIYPNGGNYIVVLRLSSSCGFQNDSTSAHIVGVNQIDVDNADLSIYPNPTKGQATILSKGALKMEKIEIYNILGQQVYMSKTDSQEKHIVNLARLASGVYTIQIFTDKGNVARKLEILK